MASLRQRTSSWHRTNLWFAGQAKNWPLAPYYFNGSRAIQWLTKKSPYDPFPGIRQEVNIEGIFGGIDTSSLADVKTALGQRPYLRPMIPKASMKAVLNMGPNANWP